MELFEPAGQHDGTVDGERYFTCKLAPAAILASAGDPPLSTEGEGKYGVFVRRREAELVTPDPVSLPASVSQRCAALLNRHCSVDIRTPCRIVHVTVNALEYSF